MEFYGDYWYGNLKCYFVNIFNKVQNKIMGDFYQRILEKRRNLEFLGYMYLQMWEFDFNCVVELVEEMKFFIENFEMIFLLEFRDVFYGGRIEVFKLYVEVDENIDIKYFDVILFYLFVNKMGKIFLGYFKIVIENFDFF